MKNVLIITDVNFWEKSSGHRVRISALIEYLSKQVNLTVVNTGPSSGNFENDFNKSLNIFILEETKILSSSHYGRRLKQFLKKKTFDTVIIEYIHCSYFLNYLSENLKIILDAHDITSSRTEEFKKYNYEGELFELSRETEADIFNIFDHIIGLCQCDCDEINLMTKSKKALLCPHPVRNYLHSIKESVKKIAFIASVYIPNIDAINWFIEECWPKIIENYDVQLLIYGTVCQRVNLSDKTDKITLKGFVPDLKQIYEETDLIINPVRFGAGLKIKNIEAMSHGIPLITSSHGARGLEKGIDNAFLVADKPVDFIRSVVAVIENLSLRERLKHNAYKFIHDNFDADSCFKPLLDSIND